MTFDILKWLDDAPIKLVHGVGHPETGGCWMAALSVYSGASWGDHPPCVCPVIRAFAIKINDMISTDEARGRIIGPYLLEPVGTAAETVITEQRRWHLVDAAIRKFAPFALRKAGSEAEAVTLESLPVVTAENAAAACAAAYAAYASADAAAYAAYAAARAARASSASSAADAARAADAADAAARASSASSASDAAARAAKDDFAEHIAMPVLLELCAIGSRVPVEPSCDEVSMRRAIQCA